MMNDLFSMNLLIILSNETLSAKQLHVLTQLERKTHKPCKTPYETPNAHDCPNAADQHWLESNLV